MSTLRTATRLLVAAAVLGAAARAHAQPIELKDRTGRSYNINTARRPAGRELEASGAVTNATFDKPVTVTSYFIGLTPFGFFLTTYTVQHQVNVPLTQRLRRLQRPRHHRPSTAGRSPRRWCSTPARASPPRTARQNGKNRQLTSRPRASRARNLAVTRKVFVPNNADFVRWLNIVTNTGTTPTQVGITLQGLLGSGAQTRITATSTGDSSHHRARPLVHERQAVPQGAAVLRADDRLRRAGRRCARRRRRPASTDAGQAIAHLHSDHPARRLGDHHDLRHRAGEQQAGEEHDGEPGRPAVGRLNCMTEQELRAGRQLRAHHAAGAEERHDHAELQQDRPGHRRWKGKLNDRRRHLAPGCP